MWIRTPWFALGICLLAAGCSNNSTPQPQAGGKTDQHLGAKLTKLGIVDKKVGTGPGASDGDKLTVVYTGKLADGTVFDSNDGPKMTPFNFQMLPHTVIDGWLEGMKGMKVGGERTLAIPAVLGYGARAQSKIPPNSDLYFDVKLKAMTRKEDENTLVEEDKKPGSGPPIKTGDTITVNYVATTDAGAPIESTFDKGESPKTFVVGQNRVGRGINAGVIGMRKGGERILTIPPGLNLPSPIIPPNSTTKFDITIVDVKPSK